MRKFISKYHLVTGILCLPVISLIYEYALSARDTPSNGKALNLSTNKYRIKNVFRIFSISLLGFVLSLFLSVQLQAQEKDNGTPATHAGEYAGKDTVMTPAAASEWLPTTSLYIELGGRVWYSLNVDFRRRENFAFCIGASYFKEDKGDSVESSQSMIFPSVMGYYLGGKKHRFELGGGLCPGFGSSEGFTAMALYGSAGYRYQKKKGLIFRVAFTPFLAIPLSDEDNFAVIPWAGISLGYSF